MMFEIKNKQILAQSIKQIEVSAPELAAKAQAGQFVILRIDETGERIPLTLADFDREMGTITLIYQEVGRTTLDLGRLEAGDYLLDLVGPLGKPSEIEKYGTVVCVGGGVGIAPIYPITRELARAGNKIISIIGARSKDHLILAEEMQSISENLYIATDDGTLGHKGFVTDILKEIIDRGEEIDLVVAIGPLVMMKAVSELTRPYEIRTVVSLNPIMVDGTGMCGACRVAVGQATKFACVDGPEFDGHQVNWSVAEIRARMFVEEEKQAMVGCGSGGECQCQKQG
jgi:ferredoxin--NADP+ reductase